jgi:hypothetical protein
MHLVNSLTNVKSVRDYLENLYVFGCTLHQKNINKKVIIDPVVGLALENPVNASAEDGMKLAYFLNMCARVDSLSLCYPYVTKERIIDKFVAQYGLGY